MNSHVTDGDILRESATLKRIHGQMERLHDELAARLERTCELTWVDANGKYQACGEPADVALSINDGTESLSLCPKHVLSYPNP